MIFANVQPSSVLGDPQTQLCEPDKMCVCSVQRGSRGEVWADLHSQEISGASVNQRAIDGYWLISLLMSDGLNGSEWI